jgi:ArsR family transcriptional regulator
MDETQFNRIAKALADPQRFALLRRIAEGGRDEVACQVLVAEFTVTPATISHHIKELAAAGLVAGRKEGQCVYLTARPDVTTAYLREVERRLVPGKRRNGGDGTRTTGHPRPGPTRHGIHEPGSVAPTPGAVPPDLFDDRKNPGAQPPACGGSWTISRAGPTGQV